MQRVGDLRHLVHQLLAVLLGLRAQIVGDLDLLAVLALGAVVAVGLHVDQVDHALKLVLLADRDLGGHHVLAEGLLERVERRKKSARSRSSMFTKTMRASPSSEARSQRRLVVTSTPITPLTTNTAPSTTRSARERVGDEARLAGRVDQVDLAVVPAKRREARGDRHLARLLVGRRVETVVPSATEPGRLIAPALEQERLVHGRLPAAPVAHQGHVADPLRRLVRHSSLPSMAAASGSAYPARPSPPSRGSAPQCRPRSARARAAAARAARRAQLLASPAQPRARSKRTSIAGRVEVAALGEVDHEAQRVVRHESSSWSRTWLAFVMSTSPVKWATSGRRGARPISAGAVTRPGVRQAPPHRHQRAAVLAFDVHVHEALMILSRGRGARRAGRANCPSRTLAMSSPATSATSTSKLASPGP